MTQEEINEAKEKAKTVLVPLNIVDFLTKIKEKAQGWKKDLINGN